VLQAPVTSQGVRDLKVRALRRQRLDGVGAVAAVQAADEQGRVARRCSSSDFGANATGRVRADRSCRPSCATRMARLDIVGEQGGAGSAVLLDERHRRRPVSILGERPTAAGQPLLQEVYFLERALDPYVSLTIGDRETVLTRNTAVLLIPDGAAPSAADRDEIAQWLERGGVAVRFAGPNLASSGGDNLVPTRLRMGDRALGGVMSWETSRPRSPSSRPIAPFLGVAVPPDVRIQQQVLAEPTPDLAEKTWARLTDGTPLVTGERRGQGYLVLIHTTANTNWSNMALSGLFVNMLRRTLAFAARPDGAGEREISGGPFVAQRVLDGFGVLSPAPPDVQPIAAEAFATARPSPTTPPGLYERAGVSAAIDAAAPDEALTPLRLPSGVAREGLGTTIERPLSGWLFGLAGLMLAIDLFIALFLIGRLPRLARAGAAGALAFVVLAGPQQAHAQSDPTQVLRLAYVRTGDAQVDRTSAAGLEALSQTLYARTSVEPGPPIGVDLARDDLAAYPFLYWPAPSSPRPLSDAALSSIDRYLAIGGLLLVDTRDAGRSEARPAAAMLAGVDVPPLELVTTEHVLTRAFYLMRSFPAARNRPNCGRKRLGGLRARWRCGALHRQRRLGRGLGGQCRQRSPARTGAALWCQPRDGGAHRELQGRPGTCARAARTHGTRLMAVWAHLFVRRAQRRPFRVSCEQRT
jgi:hypothetical protein